MKARNRPPKLQSQPGPQRPAPPPTLEERLESARVAGPASTPGRTELRHLVERLGADADGCWAALERATGTTRHSPRIDPACTMRAVDDAAARIDAVARAGGRVAFATAHPAAMLGLHAGLARAARERGAQVVEEDDAGPFRIDGRMPRWLRWIDGVACVTDGDSLLAAQRPDAGTEWCFVVGRPALVVADGPFAECALEQGIETVAFGGLDRPALLVAATQERNACGVPVHPGRPARAYALVAEAFAAAFRARSVRAVAVAGDGERPAVSGDGERPAV